MLPCTQDLTNCCSLSEEAEAKENRGTATSLGHAQSSPPRQPFRASQPPQYPQRQPQTCIQPEPWGQPQAQHPHWDLPQPKQHPGVLKQPQAGRGTAQWGQVPAGDRIPKWGSHQSQGQAAVYARGQEAPPSRNQWTAGQPQRPEAPMSSRVQGDPEGGWSDAVPILSEESSASMASVAVCSLGNKPLDLDLRLPACSQSCASILHTEWKDHCCAMNLQTVIYLKDVTTHATCLPPHLSCC